MFLFKEQFQVLQAGVQSDRGAFAIDLTRNYVIERLGGHLIIEKLVHKKESCRGRGLMLSNQLEQKFFFITKLF